MTLGVDTTFAQVDLNANLGFGLMEMGEGFNQFSPGYQIRGGATVEGAIPVISDLKWESGVEVWHGRSDFYRLDRSSPILITDDNFPLDKSEKYTQYLWSAEIPARLRYNAFGFMGIMVGVNFAVWSHQKAYSPSLNSKIDSYPYKNFNIAGETGLFFPVYDRFRIDVKVNTSLDGRFYSSSNYESGDAFSDYGFLLNVAYRLNQ